MIEKYDSLCEELPFWEFDENICILSDGSLSAAVEVTPLDIECFDNERINQLTLGLRSVVNAISENMTLQIHVETGSDFSEILSKHINLVSSDNEFLCDLDKKRCCLIQNEIEENLLLRTKVYAILHSPAPKTQKRLSLKTIKKFSDEFGAEYDQRKQELSESVDSIMSSLQSQGFQSKKLDQTRVLGVLYKYLNPKRSRNITQPSVFTPSDDFNSTDTTSVEASTLSPRSQLIFGDLVLDQNDFILDQMKTRVLTLKTLPEMTIAGMMDNFLRFPFHYDLIFSLRVADQAIEMSRIQQKRRMAHSLSQTKGGQISDIESESRLADTEGLIRELIDTGQRIYIGELMLVLREENDSSGLKRLNQKTREVLTQFKTLSGAEGIQETVGAWKIFKSNMPSAPIKLERGKRMKTNNLVDFLPLFGSRLGDEIPICLVHSRLGSLVSINPYDAGLSNYNSLVTGASGSGKSFFNNFLLLQQMARGVKVFVIDIGGSYRKLTELMNGQYFEIKLSDEYAINPFAIKDIKAGPSSEKVKALTSIIEQMVSETNSKLSKFEKVLIEKAINQTYENSKISGQEPILSDFEKVCKISDEPELRKIGKLLFSWIGDSPYGKLLDRRKEIEADSPIISFDLKGLSQYPDLQSVMILILTNFILDQVESDKKTSKRVLLDEAWELLQSQAAASFMEYAARTFRKTGSGITFITQGVEEIIKSPIGSAIMNNTATKVVMSQKGDLKPLETALKLNSREASLIQSLEQRKGIFSEAFLIEGDHRQVVRIYPSPLEYWISTSDAKDNKYLAEIMEGDVSLSEAIKKAANDYPFGIASAKVAV